MSLDDIAELLADRPYPAWTRAIEAQIQSLQIKADRLLAARDMLQHVLDHHRDARPDGCPQLRSTHLGRRRARQPDVIEGGLTGPGRR